MVLYIPSKLDFKHICIYSAVEKSCAKYSGLTMRLVSVYLCTYTFIVMLFYLSRTIVVKTLCFKPRHTSLSLSFSFFCQQDISNGLWTSDIAVFSHDHCLG